MDTFGLYSLKAGIILTLFWGIYHVCLQKETFFLFNRFFLLSGMVIALLLPLYSAYYTIEVAATDPSVLLIGDDDYVTVAATAANGASVLLKLCYRLLPVIYITGLCVLFIFRLSGLFRLFFTIRKNGINQHMNYSLIESSDFHGAFSFFRFIFISGHLQENDKHIILKHEEAHIRQKHWVDLLFVNLLNLLWWFNPAVWLYGKAIRNNHEYLADQAVLTDYKQVDYQKTLVNQWFKVTVFPIVNSFSYSNQLKRLNMMKKNISNPVKQLFALISVPALALFIWAFAEPEYVVRTIPTETVYKLSEDSVKVIGYRIDNPLVELNKLQKKPLVIIDGVKTNKDIDKLKDIDPSNIYSLNVLKDEVARKKYGEEGKNGVIEIITKKENAAIATADSQGGVRIVPNNSQDSLTSPKGKNPLIIVDGEKTDQDINTIDPANIFSISVLKDKENIKIYGEEGTNGVIEITTIESRKVLLNESADENSISTTAVVTQDTDQNTTEITKIKGNPLVIINGKISDKSHNNIGINPDDIASITVLKDKSSIDLYGEKAKDGVILITTK